MNFPMDLPSLSLIVGAAAFSPNPEERRAAEQSLNQVNKRIISSPIYLLRLLFS